LAADKRYMEDSLSTPLSEVLRIIQSRLLADSTYFGIKCLRSPIDFWIYQEIVHSLKPDVIVEIGNFRGGSALSLAHLCDHLSKGQVIGVDINHSQLDPAAVAHPRISFITGDGSDVFDQVAERCHAAETVLVIEDSSHEYQKTFDILTKYSQLVTVGSYLIVEDSICHHGLPIGPKPGPYEAIAAFVASNPRFVSDRGREPFLITWNPTGYLRRLS